MTKVQTLEDTACDLLAEFAADLSNNDPEVCSITAATNSKMWGFDVVEDVELHPVPPNRQRITAVITLAGEQEPNAGFCGDILKIDFAGEMVKTADGWKLDDDQTKVSGHRLNW